MKITVERVAAVLALVIGAMAIVAGGQVLLGDMPDYYVIGWLPVYNFTAGVITVLITAVLLWRRHRYGRAAAVITFAAHAAVMGILLAAYRPVVAPDSLRAMTIRLVVWLLILGLLFFRRRVPEPRHVTV
jgi:hypothetical protein